MSNIFKRIYKKIKFLREKNHIYDAETVGGVKFVGKSTGLLEYYQGVLVLMFDMQSSERCFLAGTQIPVPMVEIKILNARGSEYL